MDNLRGAAIMVLAMLAFAIEDAIIKGLAGRLPTGQIIAVLGLGGSIIFGVICLQQGRALFPKAGFQGAVLLRNLAELFGTVTFVTALTLVPLATVSAILQAAPLIVTFAAALVFKEQVGWRRWSAVCVGFIGVLIIIRPGAEGFDANVIFAVLGTIGLATRDLSTRRAPPEVTSLQLAFLAFVMLIPAGALLTLINGSGFVEPQGHEWALLASAIAIGAIAYYGITGAMRVGDLSFVSSFRYSRIVFALIIGTLVFNEKPDAAMLIGSAIVILSGIYTLWRERRVKTVKAA